MTIIKKSFQYGDSQVSMETGAIARQADGAVLVSISGTVVLTTVVGRQTAAEGQGFFPLTVNYQERTYSAGKIPGGFFKREGRPTEKETLVSRLIDRPLRPLFPDGFLNEIQVISTVVSLNPEIAPDIPALLGAFAAIEISGLPFNGPGAAARVGFIDGAYVLNPTAEQLQNSKLDLVVAGTEQSVLMVESEAELLSESEMLSGVVFGHEQMQTAITTIRELGKEVGKPKWEWQAEPADTEFNTALTNQCQAKLEESYKIQDKQERQNQVSQLSEEAQTSFVSEEISDQKVQQHFKKLCKGIVRGRILSGGNRIDGRDTRTVRPLTLETGLLPCVHGSALFTRGTTQALVATTLGTSRDAQIIDGLAGELRDRFMLHYNFPPYCVGETGFMSGPKRREIGHGCLAKRSLLSVMPSVEEFPYVIRVVSEITESDGSSSMATVCGTSMSLLDAGVPIKTPIAGVAMGLILEEGKFAVLTDIMGDEDHLGDMDFKVAGSSSGITALQMDIKIEGVTPEIMAVALEQAKDARLHILEQMNSAINEPNSLSEYAPRLLTIQINPDRIRDVIGKGGSTIRGLTEETGATIEIDDNGIVTIASVDKAAADLAKKRIEELTAEVEVGKIYEGRVARIMDFGAFVTILPGTDGLVHISQISADKNIRVEKVSDELSEGDIIKVKVLEVDRQGRVRLSAREAMNQSS